MAKKVTISKTGAKGGLSPETQKAVEEGNKIREQLTGGSKTTTETTTKAE